MKKNLVFIIKANQEFIRHTAVDVKINMPVLNTLFEDISDIYLPVLNMVENFEERSNIKFSMVLPPVLCSLLSDKQIHELYLAWLDKKIALAHAELERNKENSVIQSIINANLDKYNACKEDFTNKYNCNLISAFAALVKQNKIELLATCATDLFVPHYSDTPEIISAQIECGLHSYREFFGEIPEGFWIPELGYFPGVEKLIKAYGFSYTVLDARALLLSKKMPSSGIFYPVRTDNSLVLFAEDPEFTPKLFGEDGYCCHEDYRNENRDIGFELSLDNLASFIEPDSVRYSTGFKYFNKREDKNSYYDISAAQKQAELDAEDFTDYVSEKLSKAAEYLPECDFVNLICTVDTNTIRSKWSEFLYWLKKVFEFAAKKDICLECGKNLIARQYSLEKTEPYYSAKGDGYGEEFLTGQSNWMIRYVKKASERIIDLADRFPSDTGLKNRLLNLGAIELLMAQSTGLIKMLNDCDNADFAERRFKESINAFTIVFDSLGSNTVSTEWLTTLEERDSIFTWMNYKVFAKKV